MILKRIVIGECMQHVVHRERLFFFVSIFVLYVAMLMVYISGFCPDH